MLHLKRKVGQTIVINNNIEIKILEIYGNFVKLGCTSPKDTLILRKEQYSDITNENISASASNIENLDILTNLLKKEVN